MIVNIMLRYMTNSNERDACQNCKYFIHFESRCWFGIPENQPKLCGGALIEHMWLSPCKAWKKGYEYDPNVTIEMMATGEYRIGMFKRIDPEAW